MNIRYIECPDCGRKSYNKNDIAEGYCGYCHTFSGGVVHVEDAQSEAIKTAWTTNPPLRDLRAERRDMLFIVGVSAVLAIVAAVVVLTSAFS